MSSKISATAAGYMELEHAQKDGECEIVEVSGGISKKLGCCNLYKPQEDADEFRCGECLYLIGGMPILLIMRHGETEANKENRFRGLSQVKLDEQGIQRAHDAGDYLKKNANVRRIISSPLPRARQTADIVAEILGIQKVSTDEKLLPWDLGDFTDKKKSEYGDMLNFLVEHPDVKAPHGKSLNDVRAEFHPALDDYLEHAKLPNNQILLVSHGTEIIETELRFGESESPHDAEVVAPGGILAVYPDGRNYHAEPFLGKVKRGTFGS